MDPEVEDLIEELAFKYLLHLPSEEYENEVQLCYAFQLAHWEYLDAPETEHQSNKLSFNQFVIAMLDHAPGIGLNRQNVPAIVRMFNKMNWQIPVFGAILINQAMDKVLLTQTFIANNKGGAWMFPRGKVEKKDHGNSFDCACREVLEETGYDIRGKAHNDEAHYLERSIQAGDETKVVGLFLVTNVDENFPFCSQTQGEVYQFAWFRIQDLWNHMKSTATLQIGGSPARFLHVFPFINGLSAFINKNKKKGRGAGRAAAAATPAQALHPQAVQKLPRQAPSPVSPVPIGASPPPGRQGLQPFPGDLGDGLAWEPSPKDRFGFEEMVQQNARLRRGAAQRPYDGIIPQQQQLMQQNQLPAPGSQQQGGQQQGGGKKVKLRQPPGGLAAQPAAAVPGDDTQGSRASAVLVREGSEMLSARQLGSRASLAARRGQGRTRRGKSKQEKAAEASAADNTRREPAAGGPLRSWSPLQLQLPSIEWMGMPQPSGAVDLASAGDGKARTQHAPRHVPVHPGAKVSVLSGLQGSAEAWARFEVDRAALEGVLEHGLARLEAPRQQ